MRRACCFALAIVGCLSWVNAPSVLAQGGAPAYYPDAGGPTGAPGYGAPPYPGTALPSAAPPDVGGVPFDPNCPPDAWYAGAESGNAGWWGNLQAASIFDSWYARMEYLNWTTAKPANVLLGAPITGNPDPSQLFLATDAGGAPLGIAQIPTTNPFVLNGINGARVTVGTDLTYGGTIEFTGFLLENHKSVFSFGPSELAGQGRLIGTSTLVNGQLANNIEFYNNSYEAVYRSQIWGGEANYFFDLDNIGFFHINPLVGARYINLHEKLLQSGVFRDDFFAVPIDTNTQINSYTINNLAGPQVGLKIEGVTKWFALGFEPKIGVMANSMVARVQTVQFRSNFDPTVETQQHLTGVSPIIDLGCYARVNVSPNFALRVGYNFLWLGRVTRPEDNIYYNDNGAFVPPISFIPSDVVVSATRHDMWTGGISVGGEFRF